MVTSVDSCLYFTESVAVQGMDFGAWVRIVFAPEELGDFGLLTCTYKSVPQLPCL